MMAQVEIMIYNENLAFEWRQYITSSGMRMLIMSRIYQIQNYT